VTSIAGRGVALAGAVLAVMMVVVVSFGATDKPADAACLPGGGIPSSADLPQVIIDGVNALKPSYDQAGAENNVSWALLAAIDYRENGNDPALSALSGEPIGSINPDTGAVTSSKLDSLHQAAAHVKGMAAMVYGVNLTAASSGDEIKNALIAYNRGFSYQRASMPADASPYVMNQYDAAHQNMVFPSIPGETLAGRTDTRPGGFTVFTRLGGSSATGCPALSGNAIVAIAQQQIGLREIPDDCNCGPDIQKFLGSSPGEFWCADFVSWVYLQAGHPFTGGQDGGWRLAGVAGLRQWLGDNGIYHFPGDGDAPQTGDVIIFSGDEHTGLVESFDGSTINTIEGNTSNKVGRRSYGLSDPTVVGWGRMIATAPPVAFSASPPLRLAA